MAATLPQTQLKLRIVATRLAKQAERLDELRDEVREFGDIAKLDAVRSGLLMLAADLRRVA
jgi:hypothetical protein